MKKIRISLAVLIPLAVLPALTAQSQDMVPDQPSPDDFPIVAHYPTWTCVAPIYVDPRDHWLVGKAATLLQEDIRRVTGVKPDIINDLSKQPFISDLIIIGSLDQSALIQRLARQNMIPSSL